MFFIVFNLPGLAMLVIAFGIAVGIGHVAGLVGEGPKMLIAAPLCIVMDLAYRFRHPGRHWFSRDAGGHLFFLPIWTFGILWLIVGIVYTLKG